jgi:hypothetical protein
MSRIECLALGMLVIVIFSAIVTIKSIVLANACEQALDKMIKNAMRVNKHRGELMLENEKLKQEIKHLKGDEQNERIF